MTSRLDRISRQALVVVVASTIALVGCGGGGGGGGGGANGTLLSVSFVGFPTQPLTGINAGVPLPTLFRDEVLEFRFDGAIDDGIMGGFLSDAGGTPIIFEGLAPNSTGQVQYFAYREQSVARTAIEIRENVTGGPLLNSYIVGRAVADPTRLIINPRVSATNSFGLPGSVGMSASTQYTFRFPPNSPLTVGGSSVQPLGVGAAGLPIAVPVFSPAPALSRVWLVGGSFSPDPEPPTILSIASATTAAGTVSDPISATSAIEVTFSKVIDTTTIDPVRNFLVLNLSILSNGSPTLVPGQIDFDEVDNRTILTFQPSPSFGPGVSASAGYQIRVRVGRDAPGTTTIFGQPQGSPPVPLEITAPMERLFVTAPCATCIGATGLTEIFANTDRQDLTVPQPMNRAEWAPASGPGLFGPAISGGPLAGFPASPPPANVIGTRVQVTVTPSPLAAPPAGLFSPFDSAATNLGPTVNPLGGNHIMHIYEGVDLGNRTDSLELVEWGPVNNIAQAPGAPAVTNDYPSYQAWCGQTNIAAPLAGGAGNGLNLAYGSNYILATLQTVDPNGLGGVNVTGGPSTYSIPITTFRNFYPFPVFVRPFDYQGATSMTHLLLEQNIEPGTQTANFNRFRATAAFPIRRVIGAPLSAQTGATPVGTSAGFDIYNMRFTFVKLTASNQSTFYDTGLPSPDLLNIALAPSPNQQPVGTEARWEFQAASAISPAVLGATPWLTYWDGNPTTGSFSPAIVDQLDGRRFLRFRVNLRSNHLTNQRQAYTSVLFALAFTN